MESGVAFVAGVVPEHRSAQAVLDNVVTLQTDRPRVVIAEHKATVLVGDVWHHSFRVPTVCVSGRHLYILEIGKLVIDVEAVTIERHPEHEL